MNTVSIYGLCDPRTGCLRYIGKANRPKVRLYHHHCCGPKKNHRTDWLNNLKNNGLKPEMFTLEEVEERDWQEAERFWISYFRSLMKGRKLSESHRLKLCGKIKSQETRDKIGNAQRGRKASVETKKKISIASRTRFDSNEWRAKWRVAHQAGLAKRETATCQK